MIFPLPHNLEDIEDFFVSRPWRSVSRHTWFTKEWLGDQKPVFFTSTVMRKVYFSAAPFDGLEIGDADHSFADCFP